MRSCKHMPNFTLDQVHGLEWISYTLRSILNQTMSCDDDDGLRNHKVTTVQNAIDGIEQLSEFCSTAHHKLHDKDEEIEKLNKVIKDLNTRCASLEAIVEADSESAAG